MLSVPTSSSVRFTRRHPPTDRPLTKDAGFQRTYTSLGQASRQTATALEQCVGRAACPPLGEVSWVTTATSPRSGPKRRCACLRVALENQLSMRFCSNISKWWQHQFGQILPGDSPGFATVAEQATNCSKASSTRRRNLVRIRIAWPLDTTHAKGLRNVKLVPAEDAADMRTKGSTVDVHLLEFLQAMHAGMVPSELMYTLLRQSSSSTM